MTNQLQRATSFVEGLFGARRPELLEEVTTEDFVNHDPYAGDQGRAGLEAQMKENFHAFPDTTIEVLDAFEHGDRVLVRWKSEGTHHGEFAGHPPTGRHVRVEGASLFRFEGGLIAEEWDYYDVQGLLEQLGLATAPPTPQKRPEPQPRA